MAGSEHETVTVLWGGAEVRVEMRQSTIGGVAWGCRIADAVVLTRISGARGRLDCWHAGTSHDLDACGDTAQEALDKLAEQLRQIRDWAASAMRGTGERPGLTLDERDALRDAAYARKLTPEHAPLIRRLADELDDDNAACAAYVIRALCQVMAQEGGS